MTTTLEHLGLEPGTRALLVSCGGLGLSYASNQAVYTALRLGLGTTTALMVPCPWSRDAAARYRHDDVGVQLTLNAEYERYRWGPITMSPTLVDGDGGFPRTVEDLWDHADVDELRREGRAQIARALQWGFDVTHLGTHLDALTLRPEFFDVYLELAEEFDLPIRLPDEPTESRAQFPLRELAAEAKVLHPDRVLSVHSAGSREALLALLRELTPGVTEVRLRPAADSSELRAFDPEWKARVAEYQLVTGDAELTAVMSSVRPIGYRALLEAQRKLR
ncbi:MAG: ChbG/HpnK family deacetylase [Acidimicrobiales bacterium]